MTKRMKCIIALLLSAVISVPLFAGGSKEVGQAASPTLLKVTWWGGQARHESTQKVFDAYSALHPDIKFEGAPSNWAGYFDKLATQAAAGALPDIVQMDYLYLNTYAKNSSLADLYPYVNDGTIDVSGIDKNILNTGVIGGKLQALVLSTSLVSVPYNANVLKEAGVQVPSSQWTWDDFVAACRAVKQKTGKYGFGMIPGDDTNFFNYYVRQHGTSLFAADGKSLGYSDDSIMVDWLSMWKKLMDDGAIPTPDEYATMAVAGTDSNPIVTNKAAFIQEWSNYAVKVESKNSGITVHTPPALKGGEKGLWMKPGMFFSVAANSKVKAQAAAFINWFVNSKAANDIIMAERGTPVSAAIRDYMSSSGKMSPKQEEMFKYTSDAAAICGPSLPPDPQGIAEVNKAYNTAMYAVLYNQATPAKAAADFRAKANEILSRNN